MYEVDGKVGGWGGRGSCKEVNGYGVVSRGKTAVLGNYLLFESDFRGFLLNVIVN